MRVRELDGPDRRALVVRGADPEAVVAAVRDPDDDRLDLPDPGPVHEHVGFASGDLERRAALAAAARSLDRTAPQDDEIGRLRDRLDALSVPDVALDDARHRVATAGEERDRLRERVATLQGKVRALRERGAATDDAEAELAEATRRLSEAETERVAAEQALERARERVRDARDARERRLRLRDRVDNLERAAREHLAAELRPAADDAVAAASWTDADALADADDGTATLALARVADFAAPVVCAPGPFDDPGAAVAWLSAPVVQVYE